MRNILAFLLLGASIAFVPLPASADDPVVARVNGVDIKQSSLDFAASEVSSRLATLPPEDRRRMLVQYLIENELMAGAAEKENLNKEASFSDHLRYYQRRALSQAFFNSRIRKAIPEEAAKKIYDERIAQLKPEQEVRARHILVGSEDEAKQIAERLKKGEDFAALAKEKSKDTTAVGGDLGFFIRGRMIKEFEDAAYALEVGEISEPVQTQFGWHIIKVEEKRERPLPSFDEVKDAITVQLVQQKAKEVVTGLQKEAKIEILDPELKKAMDAAAQASQFPSASEPSED